MGMIAPMVGIAIASGERIFEILDTHREVRELPHAGALPPVRGQVRFERVSFGYEGRERALSDFDLKVREGEAVAFLGATGSGKSTVMNLLPRFYDPDEGTVSIDGIDIRTVTLDSLRKQIGIVLQETTLFADTIRENIRFGKPDAADEEVVDAAKAAQAHDFIAAMPEGYDTRVGERGVTLSGGQKQRVAIARALLLDPRILLLDDATSSVDAETERLIQTALERLLAGRTSFIIAQRLGTLRMADRIVVLDRGRIAAQGTHRELLESSALYADICRRQLSPQPGPAGGPA